MNVGKKNNKNKRPLKNKKNVRVARMLARGVRRDGTIPPSKPQHLRRGNKSKPCKAVSA